MTVNEIQKDVPTVFFCLKIHFPPRMSIEDTPVQICGRKAQVFAMNLMMELSQDSMKKLQTQFEEKEIHIVDVWSKVHFVFMTIRYIHL